MNFEHTQKTKDLIVQVSNFIDQKIKPKEAAYTQAMNSFCLLYTSDAADE